MSDKNNDKKSADIKIIFINRTIKTDKELSQKW